MSSHKIKKLTLQYAYLTLEKEEVEEKCQDAEAQIRSYIEKNYPDQYKQIYDRHTPSVKPLGEKEEDIRAEEEDIRAEEEDIRAEEEAPPSVAPKNKELKKLYRKIAAKIHPDKIGSAEYEGLFSRAAQAYKENDLAKLLEIAGTANIELLELSPEGLVLLEENIKKLSDEINTKRQTAAWHWAHAKSEEEKNQVIQLILHAKGGSI